MLYERKLSQLHQIAWSKTGTAPKISHVSLVKEFLKRAATYFVEHGLKSSDPFISPKELLGGNVSIDQGKQLVNREVAGASQFPLVKWVVGWHLDLCMLADAGSEEAVRLVGLHEPLIEVFSDGGAIDKHHGEIIIDGKNAISLNGWRERFLAI